MNKPTTLPPVEIPAVRTIYIFLHGEKDGNKPNPGLSITGVEQVEDARETVPLPPYPAAIICGTGHRHLETAKFLGLRETRSSILCGVADSSDQLDDNHKIIRLADGLTLPIENWMIPDTEPFLRSLKDNTILIAGRPFMLGLRYEQAKEGMAFKIVISQEDSIPPIEKVEIIPLFSPDGNLPERSELESTLIAEATH